MSRILGTALAALLVSAVGVSRAASIPPAGCINPADSALNQYCEVIPAAPGPQTPEAGMPAVGASLPAQSARRIARGSRSRVLLTLPAGAHRATGSQGAIGSQARIAGEVSKASSSFPGWLVAVLAGSTLLLIGWAAAGWRKRLRAGPGDEAST